MCNGPVNLDFVKAVTGSASIPPAPAANTNGTFLDALMKKHSVQTTHRTRNSSKNSKTRSLAAPKTLAPACGRSTHSKGKANSKRVPPHSVRRRQREQMKTRRNKQHDSVDACKDRIPRKAPESDLYFAIRKACSNGVDNIEVLKKLLPQTVCEGKDFGVWPRQHPLLHGLVKQGCVECVRYLLSLGIDVNSRRKTDGCVPLHVAFYNLQGTVLERMVSMLMDEGADADVTNVWGEPPCMFQYKTYVQAQCNSSAATSNSSNRCVDTTVLTAEANIANNLAQIVSFAATSYAVYNIATQIAQK